MRQSDAYSDLRYAYASGTDSGANGYSVGAPHRTAPDTDRDGHRSAADTLTGATNTRRRHGVRANCAA